jgi:hypothetical protein
LKHESDSNVADARAGAQLDAVAMRRRLLRRLARCP